jgi:hypothetical protein
MGGRLLAWGSAGVAITAVALALAAPALGAFPGQNGKIAFESAGGIVEAINPDGTGRTTLTTGFDPSWSPDGSRIAFRRGDGLYVASADGSGATLIVAGGTRMGGPTWSPDGTQLAFVRHGLCDRDGCSQSHLFVTNQDGTGTHEVQISALRPAEPAWSPDGTKFLATDDGGSDSGPRVFTVNVDGTGLEYQNLASEISDEHPSWSPNGARRLFARRTTNGYTSGTIASNPFTVVHPQPVGGAWAPDGSRIALVHVVDPATCSPQCHSDLFTLDPSGANEINLTSDVTNQGNPDWQPIPVNAYPRPKGASPTDVSLVPAHEPCDASTSANRTHGPPLAFPSCAPPTQKPGQLTVGTPDANGRPARLRANVRINPLRGLPSTPADEADVRLRATVNDVRLRSDLSDYTGDLELRLALQITDRDNTPHPGGPGPATVQELTHSHPLPCSATADTTVGSTCQFDTTIEALVPGAVKELQRAIWELKRIAIHDGAGNLFLTQGIFVP